MAKTIIPLDAEEDAMCLSLRTLAALPADDFLSVVQGPKAAPVPAASIVRICILLIMDNGYLRYPLLSPSRFCGCYVHLAYLVLWKRDVCRELLNRCTGCNGAAVGTI